jgi:hypothetical protein
MVGTPSPVGPHHIVAASPSVPAVVSSRYLCEGELV